MAKNNPLFKETTQEELDSINRAYGVRPQGNRTASGVTAYTDAGTRGAAYTPKTGIKGGYGVTTPYTPTQAQPAQSQPTQTGETFWQKIGRYLSNNTTGQGGLDAIGNNAYQTAAVGENNTYLDAAKATVDPTKNFEDANAAAKAYVTNINDIGEATRRSNMSVEDAKKEILTNLSSSAALETLQTQYGGAFDTILTGWANNYIKTAQDFIKTNENNSNADNTTDTVTNNNDTNSDTTTNTNIGLTTEQQDILNKAYATAKQSALETKQGTISQAYDEYRRATNPYGSVAENLAANGLSQNGGYSKYMGGQRFNAYANAVNGANKAYAGTLGDLDLSKAESTLAYEEANKTNATTEAANAETKKTNALNTLAYYTPEYDSDGNITSDSKAKITAVLKDAGYTDNEIELILGYYKQS